MTPLDMYYCDAGELLMRRKRLRTELTQACGLRELRVAVLSGTTADETINFLELLLLAEGFKPVFLISHYGRYYEDAVHQPEEIVAFQPDIVYLHTCVLNIRNWPAVGASAEDFENAAAAETGRFVQIWDALDRTIGCQIIQNNFELPAHSQLGNLDATAVAGKDRFVAELNRRFAAEAEQRRRLIVQDLHGIASRVGLRHWYDWSRYFSYKIHVTSDANLEIARSLNALIRAAYGKARKVLVLDLDNTLWGGVIGDDGVEKIAIGRETPLGEAYTAFQEYCLSLYERGILLAVCSKNTESVAKAGFEHPSSVLKLTHFSSFKANWEPKHENLLEIARELNLGVDSFVFVDDNPAERAIVRGQLPSVAVPEVGDDVSHYADFIDQGRYFESLSLSAEDLQRGAQYAGNAQRAAEEKAYANYGEYLDSLEMQAEIDAFKPVYLERIAQLTNKTNQFNLTTRRYTFAEMETAMADPDSITLFGRLEDKFGDNGLISVVLGHREGDALHLDLWLMSCRVLKRDMELAMLDALVERAAAIGVTTIYGYYLPTPKNGMVADFYSRLGFLPSTVETAEPAPGASAWQLAVESYSAQSKHIAVKERQHA